MSKKQEDAMQFLRKNFIAGLLIVLPVIISVYLLLVLFHFLDGILGKLINKLLLYHYGYTIPGLGIIFGVLVIFLVGFLATHLISRRALSLLENWFTRFPLIRRIYPASKQIINFLFTDTKSAFKKTVLIEYPRKGIYTLGFLTNEAAEHFSTITRKELVNIFIPSTPGPLTGFMVMVPKRDVIVVDVTIEAALKILISGGVVNPVLVSPV